MSKLFLDDYRNPIDVYQYIKDDIYLEDDWIIVRNYDEFVQYHENFGIVDIYSFDHDLADEHYTEQGNVINYQEFKEKTGYDCAKYLINFSEKNNIELKSRILVHSMNYYGGLNIKSFFKTYFNHKMKYL